MVESFATGIASAIAAGDGAVIVIGDLLLAAALVCLRWVTIPGDYRLVDELAEVDYSLSDSWASNLTGFGGILGTLVGTSGLVSATASPLSGSALTGLNLLFGLILLLAPLLFTTFSRLDGPSGDAAAPQYRGYVGAFLAAVMLTLWAALGEVTTSTVMLTELTSGFLSRPLGWVFLSFLLAGYLLIIIYAWRSIANVITYRSAKTGGAEKTRVTAATSGLVARQRLLAAAPQLNAGRQIEPQRWHLL
jgi:hypothetical protein